MREPPSVADLLRPLGSPLTLGMSGLAIVSLVQSGVELHWTPLDQTAQAGLVLIAVPFGLQLIACILSYMARAHGQPDRRCCGRRAGHQLAGHRPGPHRRHAGSHERDVGTAAGHRGWSALRVSIGYGLDESKPLPGASSPRRRCGSRRPASTSSAQSPSGNTPPAYWGCSSPRSPSMRGWPSNSRANASGRYYPDSATGAAQQQYAMAKAATFTVSSLHRACAKRRDRHRLVVHSSSVPSTPSWRRKTIAIEP